VCGLFCNGENGKRERERDENRELEIGGVSRWCAGERAREKDTKIVYGLFF